MRIPKSHDWKDYLARKAIQVPLSELSKDLVENILIPDDIPNNIADTEFLPKVICY